MKKTGGGGGKGHTSKHAGTHKHHARGSKHHPKHHHLTAEGRQDLRQAAHTKAKHPHHARGYAVGDLLPVCALEAVAMSLRLAGQPVSDDEVAWLWELSGSREMSIAEALEAFGLKGAGRDSNPRSPISGGYALGPLRLPHGALSSWPPVPALILGVDLPGPHAVLATPDGWWSWGSLWSPWTTAVSEAWAVSWA